LRKWIFAVSLAFGLASLGCGGGAETSPTSSNGGTTSGGSASGGSPNASPTPAPGQKGQWSVVMGVTGRGLDVSACGIPYSLGGVCSQGVEVDAKGAFHEVWTSGTPNLLTVDGSMTPTSFSAALRCVEGGATGSMSATLQGAEYVGTATLSGRTVSIRVVGGATGPCT
jgi:hypothetical protein